MEIGVVEMSTQTKSICNIRYVTDCDTELYSCGEIDGAFQYHELKNFIKIYGENGKNDLLHHLAYLQYQVIDIWRNRVDNSRDKNQAI